MTSKIIRKILSNWVIKNYFLNDTCSGSHVGIHMIDTLL